LISGYCGSDTIPFLRFEDEDEDDDEKDANSVAGGWRPDP